MKKLLIAVFSLVLAAGVSNSQAQSNTVPTFLTTAEGYLTSFNTNYTFTNIVIEVDTGYKQVTGVNAASYLGARYEIGQSFSVGGEFQFSGVGSPINSFGLSAGYNIIRHYDTEVTAELIGGYSTTFKAGFVEPGLFLKKKATVNTYFETGVSLRYFSKGSFNNSPTFWVGTGFTF